MANLDAPATQAAIGSTRGDNITKSRLRALASASAVFENCCWVTIGVVAHFRASAELCDARSPFPALPRTLETMSDAAVAAVEALASRLAAAPEATAALAPLLATLRDASVPTNNVALVATVAEQLVPVADALVAASSSVSHPSKPSASAAPAAPAGPAYDPGEVIASTAQPVSFTSPRGKFAIRVLRDRFVLESTTPKGVVSHVIEHSRVRKLLALDLGDSNATTQVMIALDPARPLVVGKQTFPTLLAGVRGKDKPITIVPNRDMGLDARLEGEEGPKAALVATLEMATGIERASEPKIAGSRGSAGVGGRGCVEANVKFNRGHLFFVDEGFAFVDRPALYLPMSDVADLRLLRADGQSSTFDLSVTPERGDDASKPPAPHEFANISREELEGVQRYLAKHCSEAGAEDAPEGETAEDESDDASDEDDDDFDAEESSDDGSDDDESDDDDREDADEEEEEDSGEEEEDSDLFEDSRLTGGKRPREGDEDDEDMPVAGGVAPDEEEEEEEEESDDDDGAFEVVAR